MYKRCLKVLTSIWKLVRVAHINKFIAKDWGLADGIYKPKKNSKHLEQFRPITLLNVPGEIFFGVIAKRMMRFVLNKKFINISIQKAGIPDFSGCIEHASMLCDWRKVALENKPAELQVIWLDLENAYGSVRHPLIEKATDFFWIPEGIRKLISGYYKCTYMRFSNAKYSTNWQKLNIDIMMDCVVSPLIFVLIMKILQRSTKDTTR